MVRLRRCEFKGGCPNQTKKVCWECGDYFCADHLQKCTRCNLWELCEECFPKHTPEYCYQQEQERLAGRAAKLSRLEEEDELDNGGSEGPGTEADRFAYERDLRDYLAKNLSVIEPGMALWPVSDPETAVEFRVDNNGRRIDILAKDRNHSRPN